MCCPSRFQATRATLPKSSGPLSACARLATMSTCHGVVLTFGASLTRLMLATLLLNSRTIVCTICSADSLGRMLYVSGKRNPSAVVPAAQVGRPSQAGGWLMSLRKSLSLMPVFLASMAAIALALVHSIVVTLISERYSEVSRYVTAMAEFM